MTCLQKIMKRMAAACLALSLYTTSPVLAALPPMLSAEQVFPGMHGTAYTVVDGTGEIKTFDVDIIGTIDQGKGSSRRIMAKASGPVVEMTGGALQGMSGSPIYIDGELVGALSAGFKGMDPYTFLITPIGDMLPIWNMPDRKNLTSIPQVDFRKIEAQKEKLKEDAEKAAAKKAEAKAAGGEPVKEAVETPVEARQNDAKQTEKEAQPAPAETAVTPAAPAAEVPAGKAGGTEKPKSALYLSGFGAAGTSFLQQKLSGLGVEAKDGSFLGAGSGASQVAYGAQLEPGGAVGVAVVFGDFVVGATGTVTAVDGNRVLAFGHPFLHKGNVNYFMTDASIVGTVNGPTDGMKIANVGNIIGRINQDREAGIGGIIGTFPSVVPIRVSVKDKSLGRTSDYTAQMAYDEDFLPALSSGIAYAAMDKTVDTLGESTASIHFEITTDAAENGKVERSNMYYNTSDVGQVAVNELAQAMNLICSNTDKESNILGIKVDVAVNSGRQTASLLSAIPDKVKVKPGDTVNFRTTIKPYRQDKETLLIPYTVPKNQREGTLHLDLRGGGFVPVTSALLQQAAGIDTSAEEDKTQTTKDKLRDFVAAGQNNEIIIAPAASQAIMSEDEQKAAIKKAIQQQKETAGNSETAEPAARKVDLLGEKAKKKTAGAETKFATKFIIDNVIHATLQVEKK